jgi:glycerophosphoryl diester phosphodiesterase
MISFCQQKNMKVIPWTVNERSAMERLVEMGVDGIITDFPDRAKDLR